MIILETHSVFNFLYQFMNYRHLFHAGNFADVLKHVVLIALSQSMIRKGSPYCYLETHAGAGGYNLEELSGQKNPEHLLGVGQICSSKCKLPQHPILAQYIEIINFFEYPQYYPGSPLIMQSCMRSQDRIILNELNVTECQLLKQALRISQYHQKELVEYSGPEINIHQQDGYLAIKSLLPPKEHRGIILIDPPYEKLDDWEKLVEAVSTGIKRFRQGIYVVWYPIKDLKRSDLLKKQFQELSLGETLNVELTLYPNDAALGLIGSGMIIVNPPWQMKETLQQCLPPLWKCMSPGGAGGVNIRNIVSG